MSGAIKKANTSSKSVAVKRYRFVRVKAASEIRKALNLKSAQSYKIHQLLAATAGR
jgi:hypothetical protein